MALIFWDIQGVIMIDYLEQGCTINGVYYAGEFRRIHQKIARQRRGKLTQCSALAGQLPCLHITSSVTASTECGF